MNRALSINHLTSYKYAAKLTYAVLQLRLYPCCTKGHRIENWHCEIFGGKKELSFKDHNGNNVLLVTSFPNTTEILINTFGLVKVFDQNGVSGREKGSTPLWIYKNQTPLTDLGKLSDKFVSECGDKIGSIRWLHELSGSIKQKIKYKIAETEASSSAHDAVKKGLGVCQDHAHIFIGCCRSVGIPARYVSGYLLLEGVEQQTAMHAWADAFVPSLGWVGFDVSNGVSPDSKYLRIAQGSDYNDVTPIKGTIFGGLEEKMSVNLIVHQQ